MTPKHTLIYPQKQEAGRAQSRPPGAIMEGPVSNGRRSQARALLAPAQHPRLPFHWKRTPARFGAKQESHEDFLGFMIYPKSVPRDLSQDFSVFPDRIPVGFYPWSRSYLGPAYARIVEASTSFPVPPEGPDSGRRVSPSAVSDRSRGARSGAPHPAPLWRGRFVCVPRAPWTHAQGGCPTLPP